MFGKIHFNLHVLKSLGATAFSVINNNNNNNYNEIIFHYNFIN